MRVDASAWQRSQPLHDNHCVECFALERRAVSRRDARGVREAQRGVATLLLAVRLLVV